MRFEAGEVMADIKIGNWDALGGDAAKVRIEVFVQEQKIPEALEWDEADHEAVHAVAYNGLGQAVATGRLLKDAAGTIKVGRMAVKRVLRGSHLGHNILQALTDAAIKRGDGEIVLHAQRSAEGFYKRAGFTSQGEPFDEVNIAHIEMVKRL
jgi:predicted GNAT family N-acyltransferase